MACVDHKYERGAYGVCRRCGGEDPRVEEKRLADHARLASWGYDPVEYLRVKGARL